MIQHWIMLTCSLSLLMMVMFRNSIPYGTKFFCLCQKFHPLRLLDSPFFLFFRCAASEIFFHKKSGLDVVCFFVRSWSSGSWTAHGRHPSATRGDHLSTRKERHCCSSALLNGPIRFPQTPFRCPRSRTATLELGGHSTCLPCPYAGLTVH